jgi:hypothetical protein
MTPEGVRRLPTAQRLRYVDRVWAISPTRRPPYAAPFWTLWHDPYDARGFADRLMGRYFHPDALRHGEPVT